MANLEALLKSEAKSDIDAIISEAKERASEIVAKAEEEAQALTQQRQRNAQSQHDAALVRGKSAAQLEASSLKLRTQHKLVEDAFAQAKQEIDKVINDKNRYKGILESLFEETLETLEARTADTTNVKDAIAQVTVNGKDKSLVEGILKAHNITATVATDDAVVGGLKVRVKDANVVVANSLYARLEAARDTLASDVSKTLFAGR